VVPKTCARDHSGAESLATDRARRGHPLAGSRRRHQRRGFVGGSDVGGEFRVAPALAPEQKIVRYAGSVTGLLEKALKRVEALSESDQDAIASQILESLDDEEAWGATLDRNRDHFRALSQEALDEHRRGETRPFEELLGE
jgi:hypothetical protein